jgi:hypothetical protein
MTKRPQKFASAVILFFVTAGACRAAVALGGVTRPPSAVAIAGLDLAGCDHWGQWFAVKAVDAGEVHGLYPGGRTTRAFPYAPRHSPPQRAVLVHEPAPVSGSASPYIYKARLCFSRGMQIVRDAAEEKDSPAPVIESEFLADYGWFNLAYNLRRYPWVRFVQIQNQALSLDGENAEALYLLVWADEHRFAHLGFVQYKNGRITWNANRFASGLVSCWSLPQPIYKRCIERLHEAEHIRPDFFEALRLESDLLYFNFRTMGPINPNWKHNAHAAERINVQAFTSLAHLDRFLLGMSLKRFYTHYAPVVVGIRETHPQVFKKNRKLMPAQLLLDVEKLGGGYPREYKQYRTKQSMVK